MSFDRLTPPYMFVLMIFAALFAYIGDGPFWHLISKNADNCHTNWWYNLLYINNFVKETDEVFKLLILGKKKVQYITCFYKVETSFIDFNFLIISAITNIFSSLLQYNGFKLES